MEGIDSQLEQHPTEETKVSGRETIGRLNRWVKERPFTSWSERRVRQNIANAVTTDILHPVGTLGTPKEVENYRADVDRALQTTTLKLAGLTPEEKGIVKKSEPLTDKTTGAKFITQIREEGDVWVSEEVSESGVISRAKIKEGRAVSLTLSYKGPRYEKTDANPALEDRSEFPTGTKVLFLNHAATLGIIDWKGK